MTAYAELQTTSNFSFLRGAAHPEELVAQAAALGLAAIAITDRNSLAGVVRGHLAAREAGIRMIVGARLDFTDAPSLICLPTDRAAYGRLSKLITLGRRRAPKGECHLALADFFDHCDGQIALALAPDDGVADDDTFVRHLRRLGAALPGSCYLAASNPLAGTLVNNTIAQNGKEGVYAGWYDSGYSTLTLTNNIIASHTTGIYAYPDLNPNVVTATHTLFYGNNHDTGGSIITSTEEITGSDPLFVDSAGRDYHLRAGSPAIDTGASIPWLTSDVDGDPRPWPVGGGYDIGADEAHWGQVYLPQVLKSSG